LGGDGDEKGYLVGAEQMLYRTLCHQYTQQAAQMDQGTPRKAQ
jgi:hypothetical protein